jgi:hypothetical protein
MKTKVIGLMVLMVAGFGMLSLSAPHAAEPAKQGIQNIDGRKLEETEAKGNLTEPHFGYVGDLGTFAALTKNAGAHEPMAAFVVHQHPDETQLSLGCTKLKYQGAKRLGNVDGWVFTTDWDGKNYPSKVFLSAEKVYFGGGVQAYIAADHRNDTGWTWKMLPLRRMELTNQSGSR